jgi:hypothetical protein
MAAWFGPKFTGFGFSPRTWQGWLATAALVAGLVYHRFFFRPEAYGVPHWAKPESAAFLIVAYLLMAYFTYDPDTRRPWQLSV